MAENPVHANDDAAGRPHQGALSQMQGAVGQGGQGQSQVDKSMVQCVRCKNAGRAQRPYISATNWSKHVANIHHGVKGSRLKDWCYKGEEPLVNE